MNTKLIAAGLALVGMVAPSSALADSNAASQSANNSQHNSGSVTLAPSGGTQVNNNVNNAYSSTYSFGVGINCPTPSFAVNAFGGGSAMSSDTVNYGGSISYIMPIGGEVGKACKEHVKEITKQRRLDTQVNLVRVCADFARRGITIDTEAMPEFAICSAISVK